MADLNTTQEQEQKAKDGWFSSALSNIKQTISNAINPDVIRARMKYNKMAAKTKKQGEKSYKQAQKLQEQADAEREAYYQTKPHSQTREWLHDKELAGTLSDIEKKYVMASDKQTQESYFIPSKGASFKLQDNAVARVWPSIIDSVGTYFSQTKLPEYVAAGLPMRETTWGNQAPYWKKGKQHLNKGEDINPFNLINFDDAYMREVKYARNHSGNDVQVYDSLLRAGWPYAQKEAKRDGTDNNILLQAANYYSRRPYNGSAGYKDTVRINGLKLLNNNPNFALILGKYYGNGFGKKTTSIKAEGGSFSLNSINEPLRTVEEVGKLFGYPRIFISTKKKLYKNRIKT